MAVNLKILLHNAHINTSNLAHMPAHTGIYQYKETKQY